MSEKKKPWAVKSVFGRTVDELASHLEDALNKYTEEGYSIRMNEMHPKEGFSYLVIAHKEAPAPSPQIHVVSLGDLVGSQVPEPKPITGKFLEALTNGIAPGDWDSVERNAVKVLPDIVGKYTSTDLIAIADDLDAHLKLHAEGHVGDPNECPHHRVFASVSKMLRERVNLHIS